MTGDPMPPHYEQTGVGWDKDELGEIVSWWLDHYWRGVKPPIKEEGHDNQVETIGNHNLGRAGSGD